ncbi:MULTISPECIES: outer membrane protein assembly factor BamB family protein [unclassified Sphingomonas]|uniref:outer membrane protein assembly factor BamB family protein n=1 Tax=unclassified Sphingomonas TaxID=196159 RepID=UPI0022B339B8|nr:PQQ-like beta-propeller repeat protein [Sphingomonas sp. NIBR02145]WHU02847.1 PQQ-binding-like beta-propeller repeat protein [Sphingomonas sp. NIBR02145]
MNNKLRVAGALAALALVSGCGVFKGSGGKKTPVLGERVPILMSENDITSDKSLANVDVLVPEAAVNEDWTQPGGNAAKSMGHLALSASPSRVWSKQVAKTSKRERLAASPVIAGGKLFVMDTDGVVHAMSADSGNELWTAATVKAEGNKTARFGGGVSVAGEHVFATNGLGDVVSLNVADGTEVWRKRPGGPLRGAPTLANDNLYVVTQDNQLFAMKQENGDVSWTASASLETQGVFGVAAPASAQGTLVAGFSSGELNAYRYENGRQLWSDVLSRSSMTTSVSSLSDIDAEPVIDQGRVYAVGQGGRMVAMDIATGNRMWEQNIAGISTPWVAGEWLFVVTDDARLLCLSRTSGKVRWISQLKLYKNAKKPKNPYSWVGPVLAGGKLILGNTRGELVFVSPADGSISSTIDLKDPISLQPVVVNNTLYVLDEKGRLTAFR